MKKKYVRSYNEIWHERKRTVGSMLLLFAVIMVGIMGVRAVLGILDFTKIKDILTQPTETHKYSNLYNASRYFFRIYYPDDWSAGGETHGFMMNEQTGLVAELYPLVYTDPITPGPDAAPKATTIVSFERVRDRRLTVSYYYKNYTSEMLSENNAGAAPSASPESGDNGDNGDVSGAGSTSVRGGNGADNSADTSADTASDIVLNAAKSAGAAATQDAVLVTPDPAAVTPVPVQTDIKLLDIAAKAEYNAFVDAYGDKYNISMLMTHKTDLYTFRYFTYSYTDLNLMRHMADVYIIARSSNYIVIVYEGIGQVSDGSTPGAYTGYRESFLEILNEFRLSVFED